MPILEIDRDRYLALVGMDGIGRHLLSRRVVVVCDRGVTGIVWFNPAAAHALGIADLDDPQPHRAALATALLTAIRHRIAGGYFPRGGLERLRLDVDLSSRPMTCRFEPVRLPGGEAGLLVEAMEPFGAPVTDPAEAACRLLAGTGLAAVMGRGGGLVASAGNPDAAAGYGGLAGALHAAASAVPHGPRAVPVGDAATLLLVPAPLERRQGGDRRAPVSHAGTATQTGPRIPPRLSPDWPSEVPPAPPSGPDPWAPAAEAAGAPARPRELDLLPPEAAAPPPAVPASSQATAPVPPSPAEIAVTEPVPEPEPEPEPEPPPAMPPPPSGRTRTRRFSWQMDAAERFTFVSPELVEEVGPKAGDVVGSTWREVADRLGLDPARRIDKALAARLAWSGHWVVWTADDGYRIPVDLAAVPSNDETGRFGGFRGFGLVRAAEARPPASVAPVDIDGAATAGAAESPAPTPAPVVAAPDGTAAPPVPARTAVPDDRPVPPPPPADTGAPVQTNAAQPGGPASSQATTTAPAAARPPTMATTERRPEAPEPQPAASPSSAERPAAAAPPESRAAPPASAPPAATAAPPPERQPPAQPPVPEAPRRQPPVLRYEAPSEPPARRDPAAAASPAGEAADAAHPPQPPARLSRPEQEALHLIASALGARIEGEDDHHPARNPTSSSPASHRSHPAPPPVPVVEPLDDEDDEPPWPSLGRNVSPFPPPAMPAPPAPPMTAQPRARSGGSEDTDIVDRMPVGVLICREGEVVHANPAALALLGHADVDALAAAGGLGAVFATPAPDAPAERRVAVERADGSRLPVTAHLHRVPWRGGRALMVVLSPEPAAVDAGSAGRAAAGIARPVPGTAGGIDLDAVAEAVLLVDRDGTVTAANPAAADLLGRRRGEIVGAMLTHLVAIDSRLPVGAVLADLLAQPAAPAATVERELLVLHPERGQVPVAAGFGRLGGEPPAGLCVVLRDLTRFRDTEAALTAATREAQRISAHKSEVLARVSHEIRTPLNAIIGFAEVMLEEKFGPLGNERYREYLRDVRSSGTLIMSLVNDLLDIAKIEAGRADLAPEPVSLNEIVQASIALIHPKANAERVFVRSTLAAGLPDVLADRRSLSQILLNLLSNAVKFNAAGGQVIVSTRRDEGGGVSLRVRDTGIGMSGDEIALALEPFRQVNGGHEGTGLGLPLTKALVEANAATFSIQSSPGRGTLVEVLFPAARILAA